MVFQENLHFRTKGHGAMRDLTALVQSLLDKANVQTGVAHLFAVGSTAALGVIEFEPGLQKDLPEMLDRLMPPSREYGHELTWHDGNGHSHLQATMLGPSLGVPITQGRLALGTWQQIFHLECDIHARDRTIIVTIMGE